MTKNREVTGTFACVYPPRVFLRRAIDIRQVFQCLSPTYFCCLSLPDIFHHLSNILSLCPSLQHKHTLPVFMHNPLLLGVPLVIQGTLQVNCYPNSNLKARTAEKKLCKGVKSIFHHIALL